MKAVPLESTIKEEKPTRATDHEPLNTASSSKSSDSASSSASCSSSDSENINDSGQFTPSPTSTTGINTLAEDDMGKPKTQAQREKLKRKAEEAENAPPKKKSRKDLVKEGKIRKKQDKRAEKLAKKMGLPAPPRRPRPSHNSVIGKPPRGKFSGASARSAESILPSHNANMEPLGVQNKMLAQPTPHEEVPPVDASAPRVKHLKPGSKAEKYAREKAARDAKRAMRIANGEVIKPKKKKKSKDVHPAGAEQVAKASVEGSRPTDDTNLTVGAAAHITPLGAAPSANAEESVKKEKQRKKQKKSDNTDEDSQVVSMADAGATSADSAPIPAGDFISLVVEGPVEGKGTNGAEGNDATPKAPLTPWEEKLKKLTRRGKLERGARRKGVTLEEFVALKEKKAERRDAKKVRIKVRKTEAKIANRDKINAEKRAKKSGRKKKSGSKVLTDANADHIAPLVPTASNVMPLGA